MRAFASAVKRAQIQLLLVTIAISLIVTFAGTSGSSSSTTDGSGIQLTSGALQNTKPSGLYACKLHVVDTSAACLAGALRDFDRGRAAEGLGPMTLPSNYASLNAAKQLLVLANIDRVSRHLAPISGLSSALSSATVYAANHAQDPAFPSYAREGGSNWANTTNPLWSEFLWVYDDGYGSGNLDCTSPSASACWGHRDNILAAWQAPIVMGASTGSTGSAQLILGLDTFNRVDELTWASVLEFLPSLAPAPPRPTNVTAARGDGSVTVRWAVANTNVTKFVISVGGRTYAAGPAARALKITGLRDGTRYWATVRAYNHSKVSAPTTSRAFIPAGPPGRPGKPTASVSGTWVTLSWSPSLPRGASVKYYLVHRGPRTWRTTARTIMVQVAPGVRTFTVNAVNVVGAGPQSAGTTVTVR